MAVKIIRVFVAAMAHEFLAHVLDDSCLDQPELKVARRSLKR